MEIEIYLLINLHLVVIFGNNLYKTFIVNLSFKILIIRIKLIK